MTKTPTPLPLFRAIKITMAIVAAVVEMGIGEIFADGKLTKSERAEAIRAFFIDPDGKGSKEAPVEAPVEAIVKAFVEAA